MKRVIIRILSLVLVVALWISAPPAQAAQLTGKYMQDGMSVISTLRAALSPSGSEEEALQAKTEAAEIMDAFTARYHGVRYEKMISFTTFRTIFNTLASSYRSASKRPISASNQERLLSQLDKVEIALKRES